ncbi:MAG: hypothetical protein Q8K85_12860 [Hyphomicrobium sp.]|nr:hypothetical protein [Hyphomicrobium sp.]
MPENAVTPFGPVVVPLTRPLPAVTEVDRPPAVAVACPLRDVTTVHSERRLPLEALLLVEPLLVEALELDPVELPTLTELDEPPTLVELLELTCASAGTALIPASTIEVRRILINASR